MFEWSRKSHFSILFLKFLKNGKSIFDNFDIKGSPLWKKKSKISKNQSFVKKLYFFLFEFVLYMFTPHLKWKKQSNNSSWDFEYVLDTMYNYWVGQDENFCPKSTPTRWRCYHFSKKRSKSKFDSTLSIKKTFVTPKFCGQNFSQMHHFEDMNFLSPLDSLYLL